MVKKASPISLRESQGQVIRSFQIKQGGVGKLGVGGHGTYLPFLRVAENLKIPLFIFSDAEKDTKNSVIKQFKDSGYSKKEDEVIIFLTEGNNFEKELLNDGFAEEMKKAITKVDSKM